MDSTAVLKDPSSYLVSSVGGCSTLGSSSSSSVSEVFFFSLVYFEVDFIFLIISAGPDEAEAASDFILFWFGLPSSADL